jgi:hypothetical protein
LMVETVAWLRPRTRLLKVDWMIPHKYDRPLTVGHRGDQETKESPAEEARKGVTVIRPYIKKAPFAVGAADLWFGYIDK